ncbi:NAD(P)-binding protein [Atractiella rhizophila]|nr:NAD(P)-binding protein [Atractiella rhizophila]
MVLSTDPSAPLVAITGITGQQGSSVARALISSPKPYRLRGFSRDTTKEASVKWVEKGVDMRQVNLVVGNEEAIRKALEGSEIVFLVTNFWEHMSYEKETQEGKMMVTLAFELPTLKFVIWSGLPNYNKITNGKYTHVYHFDGKEEVSVFLAEKSAASEIPYAVVQAGWYMNTFIDMCNPQDFKEGKLRFPLQKDTPMPMIDIRDYGFFVQAAIEQREKAGNTIQVFSEVKTVDELVKDIGDVTGKKLDYSVITVREVELIKALPEMVEVGENFAVWDEYGYFGQKHPKVNEAMIGTKLTSWKEWVKEHSARFD